MPYIITITNDSPQALAYVEKAKKLDFVKVTKTKEANRTLTPKEKEFKKMFMQGLKEMKAIREGKMEAGNLDDLLNEL